MIKVIKTEEEYRDGLKQLERLMDRNPDPDSADGETLQLLSTLIGDYETKRFPESIPDPVEAILFCMEQQNLTPRDLIPYIGSRSKVSEVLSRKRPLTVSMMRALEVGLHIPAKILLKEPAFSKDENTLEWDNFPIREMDKYGYFEQKLPKQLDAARKLVEQFFTTITQANLTVLLRKTNYIRSARPMDKHALLAWSNRVIKLAQQQKNLGKYKSGSINLEFMRQVGHFSKENDGPIRAQKALQEIGVSLVVERHLSHTYLDGAAIMVFKNHPIIGLTIRHDRIDSFWFTLMHELAHICLHSNQQIDFFYDDLDIQDKNDNREKEADDLADEALVPNNQWENSAAKILPSANAAEDLAKRLNIHPAIVAGKMRFDKKNFRRLHQLVGYGKIRNQFPNVKWGD